jgi:hypothetical protein
MISARDPAGMTPKERLEQIVIILATGYRRLQLRRQKALDETAQDEAPCDRPVNGDVADAGQEDAA